tara:strand:- start:7207 stop:9213 length:2007 start_codon:yes stop_codon:yes gene_type:complete
MASDQVKELIESIKNEQQRIDQLDKKLDGLITLKSDIQSGQATYVYLELSRKIVENITRNFSLSVDQKINQLKTIESILNSVGSKNIHFYTQFSPSLELVLKIQEINDTRRMINILNSNVVTSLDCIPFFIDYKLSQSFLLEAVHIEPSKVLENYKQFKHKTYSNSIIDEAAMIAPMKIKTYLHSWNSIHKQIKESKNRTTQIVYDIYEEVGPISRAYILLNDIIENRLSISEAHQISKTDISLFPYLIQMQSNGVKYGSHSSNEALKYQCLKKVNIINDLHEESDIIRFRILESLNSKEIYTLIVYSEEEIYTSTFLGMYTRLVKKIDFESNYEFLFSLKFNRFRTFIKMCAGYNMLDDFLSKMGEFEKQKLFDKLVQGIENANDNLSSAVTLVDTYGSIKSIPTKLLFEQSILTYYSKVEYSDAQKIYGSILSVCNIGDASQMDETTNNQRKELEILSLDRILKGNKNIQQHFFFDDEDGRASYSHFLTTFNKPNWTVEDHQTYIIIKSVEGKKIEIYANKPSTEYAGQNAINSFFKSQNRWPDIVVHRGHSYFVDAAIESLTPSAEVVFLGSCGGYNIISQVLKYSPDAQIISSKQIGTLLVNDRLCYTLNETIRKGEDLDWQKLWINLNKSFVKGSIAHERFQDYVPPHKNLGALLIATYRSIL